MAGSDAAMTTIQQLETITVQSVDGTDGKIVYVWLDRPRARNACSTQLLEDLVVAFAELQRNFEVRIIVLAGRGKSFCAGADVRNVPTGWLGPAGGEVLRHLREARYYSKCWDRAGAAIRNADAITLARVHGDAVGGGLGLGFACDLLVMEENTRIFLPEVEFGTPMIGGLTPVLASAVGNKRAMEMILGASGEEISPQALKKMGLVNRLAAGEAALDKLVSHYATRIAGQPEVALHSVKMQFRAIYQRERLGDMTEWDADQALIPEMRSRLRNEDTPLTVRSGEHETRPKL